MKILLHLHKIPAREETFPPPRPVLLDDPGNTSIQATTAGNIWKCTDKNESDMIFSNTAKSDDRAKLSSNSARKKMSNAQENCMNEPQGERSTRFKELDYHN